MSVALSGFIAGGVLASLILFSMATPTIAQPVPHYPEIVATTDDLAARDPDLARFLADLNRATRATVREEGVGHVLDPQAMLPFLAGEIELLSAPQAAYEKDAFRSLGSFEALEALATAYNLRWPRHQAEGVVAQRKSMYFVAELLRDPVFAAAPWLAGRVCGGAYARIDDDTFAMLVETSGYDPRAWLVARPAQAGGEPPEILDNPPPVASWPKEGQLVPLAYEQKRSAGSTGVMTPEGTRVFFDGWAPQGRFGWYLDNHLCVEWIDGAWKVTAIAMRLD